MSEKPKDEPNVDKKADDPCEPADRSTWSEDQKNREYYYDDAHGYEKFQDDHEDDENAEE